MGLNRRAFLKYSLMAGYGLGSGSLLNPARAGGAVPVSGDTSAGLDYAHLDPRRPQNFHTPLRRPAGDGLLGILDVPAGTLPVAARPGVLPLIEQRPSPVLLYQTVSGGRRYQNPIFRITRGGAFNAVFRNALSQPGIIHWHGLINDWRMDGNPLYAVNPGADYHYGFTVQNRAGAYWYHPHPHGFSAPQTFAGLSSFFLVDDADDARLRQALDLHLGQSELPLMIQDKRFDGQGRLLYAPDAMEKMMGYLGNVILVNFTPNPVLHADTRVYRFRVLNASTARMYRLAFMKDGAPLPYFIIGTDGGLLDRPCQVRESFLSPAERLDILLDLSRLAPGDTLFLRSLAFDPMENDMGGMSGGGMGGRNGMSGGSGMTSAALGPALGNGEAFNLMQIAVARRVPYGRPIPAALSSVRPVDTAGAATRHVTLSLQRMQWLINGQSYRMDAFPIVVAKRSTEIWEIANDPRSMPHPMHLHGVQFQVLSRQGSPAQVSGMAADGSGRLASDLGWRDTVTVWPGETVRIAAAFNPPFPGDQNYLFHCHNLEHEDGGMMVNYQIRQA